MNKNTILIILVSLLLVVGFAYFFVSPKYGPQVEVNNGGSNTTDSNTLPDLNSDDTSSISQDQAVELAKADLVNSAGADSESIEVTSVEMKEFGDASLGCPKEGELYAQIVTPGYQILLQSNDTDYDYRVSKDGSSVVMCSE